MKQVIIFDFNGTLYDPETRALFPKAKDILEYSSENDIDLYLYSRGKFGRKDKISACGIDQFFKSIDVTEEKTVSYFENIQSHYDDETIFYVVGDCLAKEIQLGALCGMQTIWIRKGKFSSQNITDYSYKPDMIVFDILEFFKYLKHQV